MLQYKRMNGLINLFLHYINAFEWLHKHDLEWLVSQRVINTISVIIGSVLVYYAGKLLINKGLRQIIRGTAKQRSWHKKDTEKREKTLISLSRSFWRVLMIAYTVAMLAKTIFDFDLSPLFASAGIIGIAIGFGSQTLIKDFLSGIFIIADNQYRVGDVVDIMGSVGTVERVGTRTTVLRDFDGNVHYIPNGTISKVVNKTMGYSMSRFTISLPPETDVANVAEIINSVGEKLAKDASWKHKIIDPPKYVAVDEITGRSVELIISGKTMPSDQWAVTSEMKRRLLQAFEKNHIALASPVSAVSLKKG